MKVTVLEVFQDKFGNHHNVGDVIDIAEKDRIENLSARNLIKAQPAEEKTTTTTKATKKKKEAV